MPARDTNASSGGTGTRKLETGQPSSIITAGRRRQPSGRPRKTANIVAQRIVDQILEEDLGPGSSLSSERDMLGQFEVSRGTLREALRILETYGLITIKSGPGGGAIVADSTSRPLASVIALVLQLNHTSFRAIIDARLQLEPLLAHEAAERRTDEDLQLISESIEEMKRAIGDPKAFLAQNHVFHAGVAAAAKSPLLYNIVISLNWILDGTALGIDYGPDRQEAIVAAHRRIYLAIEAGAAEMAEAAMRIHIGEFASHAERHYAHVLDEPLRWDQVDS